MVPHILGFNPERLLKHLTVGHEDDRRIIYNFNEISQEVPRKDYDPQMLLAGTDSERKWLPHGLILLKSEIDKKQERN